MIVRFDLGFYDDVHFFPIVQERIVQVDAFVQGS